MEMEELLFEGGAEFDSNAQLVSESQCLRVAEGGGETAVRWRR